MVRLAEINAVEAMEFYPFGRGSYRENQEKMRMKYRHPINKRIVTFMPTATCESLEIIAGNFNQINCCALEHGMDDAWLQLGLMAKTEEGIFINSQNCKGDQLGVEELYNLRGRGRKEGGVWVLPDEPGLCIRNLVFVPYGFKTGMQTAEEFARNPLASSLAGTWEKSAYQFLEIARHYGGKSVVYVGSTDKGDSFEQGDGEADFVVAGLSPFEKEGHRGIYICGYDSIDIENGFAFGRLEY